MEEDRWRRIDGWTNVGYHAGTGRTSRRPVSDPSKSQVERVMRHYHYATVSKSVSIGCLVVWMVAMCSPCLVRAVACQEEAWYQRHDDWNGFSRYHFKIGQQAAYLLAPGEPAAGRPWVWRARFPNYHAEIDIELLKLGFHVGYVDVAGLFGNPAAVEIGDHFYRYVCQHASLNPRPSLEGVSRLLGQAPALWQEMSGSFRTDLSLEEILQLGLLLRSIPADNLRQGVIDNQVVRFGTTAGGDQVLYPDIEAIRALIQEVFGNG